MLNKTFIISKTQVLLKRGGVFMGMWIELPGSDLKIPSP